MAKLKLLLATGLGTGYLPIAPGTWASAVVAVLYVLLVLARASAATIAIAMAVLAILSALGCIWSGQVAEQTFGRKDPHEMTLDEFAGQAVAYLLLPVRAGWIGNWPIALAGFLAFRVMDIVKPPPANALQRLPAGWGIAIDDLVAGLYANLVMQIVFRHVWCL
jgi:phosphatidylglycerophosphatase A